MVSFYLLTGFLGSGKTTLLKHLLNELGAEKRIAVIQNEFAPTGVDGKELKQISDTFKLIEINNGSVFCVCQLSNFIDTIEKVVGIYQPEMIFLETSGLADPISISELLMHPSIKNTIHLEKIITVVDAVNFEKGLSMMPRVRHQIMVADTVLVNKSDLMKDSLANIKKQINKISPFASVELVTFCNISMQKLLEPIQNESNCHQFKSIEAGGRPEELRALVLRTGTKISLNQLKKIVAQLKQKCVRIKGFVNLDDDTSIVFHTVFNEDDYKEVSDYKGQTEVIAFSSSLSLSELRKMFKIQK
jgi:G3E family GTPase